MAKWNRQLNDMTNNSKAGNIKTPDGVPIGYVVRKEPKATRRSFALQQSVLDALQSIATEQGSNINALVNDILLNYVNEYQRKGKK